MRLRLRKKALRRDWRKHPAARGAVLEHDIGVGHGRLYAKLLVFESRKRLRHFWKHGLDLGELGRSCLGAVNQLTEEIHFFPKKGSALRERKWIEADPRYFCVIGLVVGWLSMEIISHESVHAGFAYAKRKARTPWDTHIEHFDEEAVCYPAGRIAREINNILDAAGLYTAKQKGTDRR